MHQAKIITVIETSLATRGDGERTPVRILTQYWTQAGELLAEKDPCAWIITPEQFDLLDELFRKTATKQMTVEEAKDKVRQLASINGK